MGTLFVDKLDPQSGTSLELGSSGDTLTVPSGTTLDIASGATFDATGATVTGVTGGLVLVGSVTDDSGSSVITLDNIFSSTYKSYLIQMTRLTPSSGGANIEFLFRDSSSADLSANYGYASRTLRANDGSESTRNGDNQSYVTITTAGINGVNSNTSGQGLRMSLFVADPFASEQTGYHGNFSILDNAGYGIAGYLGGIHQANSSVRGFKLRPSTGTITKATIRVYGLVDS